MPDRDALQGLWVAEKVDLGKDPKAIAEASEMIGKTQFLVAGDVWWDIETGEHPDMQPNLAILHAAKSPKWLDLTSPDGSVSWGRCIYELTGDTLRIAVPIGDSDKRPAEFTVDGERVGVLEFRRAKLPPAAGEKALVGSWEKGPGPAKADGTSAAPPQRLEILDGFLFAFSTEKGRPAEWVGGKYTVDTTKNPKWIDVELTGPAGPGKVTKLYGCYEVANGRLRMALGIKRATRPLEFEAVPDVVYFDLKTAKEPLAAWPVAKGTAAPPKTANKPAPKQP